MCITNTSRKGNLSCSLWILGFGSHDQVIFEHLPGEARECESSMYLGHFDGFSDVDPNAISLNV